MSKPPGRRGRARELLVQALYQMQVAGHDRDELLRQFKARPEYASVEQSFFDEALVAIVDGLAGLDAEIGRFADRPVAQLDPVERGILLLGLWELRRRPDVPWRVAISEAVLLCKRFGAVDSHKYVNAVLDRASLALRPDRS